MSFLLSDHALERFVERHDEAARLDDDEVRQVLLAELEHSTPYGAQSGSDLLLLLPCGLVAAVRPNGPVLTVKTILTKELAIANMESRGVTLSDQE